MFLGCDSLGCVFPGSLFLMGGSRERGGLRARAPQPVPEIAQGGGAPTEGPGVGNNTQPREAVAGFEL